MDETERVAVHSLYKEIKNLIEKKNPHDRNALAQIEEIKGKSKSYSQFLENIAMELNPTYHAEINLKPLDVTKKEPVDYFHTNSNISQNIPEQHPRENPAMPKIVIAQTSQASQPNLPNKMGYSFPSSMTKPAEIISKNSSFNKSTPQSGFANSFKPNALKHANNEMPPPQTNQKFSKESKMLEAIGINENEERELIERSNMKKNVVQTTNNSYGYHEKFLLNENALKAKLEKKMTETNIKISSANCMEMFNIGFSFFVKNLLTNLEKVAAIEKNSETLQGFMQKTENMPVPMNIIENQEIKKALAKKKSNNEQFNDINFSLLTTHNKTQILKQIETHEKEQQIQLEEKIKGRKLFELYEEKPTKKIKKQTDDIKDIYDLFLKNKNDKARESDNQKKNAEATSRTIDILLQKGSAPKAANENKEASHLSNENRKANETKKNDGFEKLRITLKTLIYVLERDSLYRKMPLLLKAYMKQNY